MSQRLCAELPGACRECACCVQVSVDGDTGQTIISGMGELHLDIYVERMRREYKVRPPALRSRGKQPFAQCGLAG